MLQGSKKKWDHHLGEGGLNFRVGCHSKGIVLTIRKLFSFYFNEGTFKIQPKNIIKISVFWNFGAGRGPVATIAARKEN